MDSAPPASQAASPEAEPGSRTLRWRGRLGWLCCGALTVLAYWDLLRVRPEHALPEELQDWFFVPSSSVEPAVVLMGLWLVYRRLPRLRALPDRPGSLRVGAALLAGGVGTYLWATYTGAPDLLVPSLILNALACAWLWRGAAALRVLALPLAFLVFAMPLPGPLLNQVIFKLQLGTTRVAGAILYGLGVPHVVWGERIVRPENTFSVIESCSGLRSMETLSIVAILMIDLFRRRGLHAWLVVLAAPPVAFLLNGLRAVLLILNPHSEIAAIHTAQGVAILLGGVVTLFAFDGLLEWAGRRRAGRGPDAREPAPPAGEPGPQRRSLALPATAAGLATCVLAALWLPRWQEPARPTLTLKSVFERGLGGSLRTTELDTDRLYLGSATFRQSFTLRYSPREGDPVVLFFGLGDRQRRSQSPLSPKTERPGSGWIVEERFPVRLEPAGPTANAFVLRSGGSRVLTYQWVEGAQSWPVELLRAFLALDRSPLRRREEIRVVRIGTAIVGSPPLGKARAEQNLLSFYHLLRPLLEGPARVGLSRPGKSFS